MKSTSKPYRPQICEVQWVDASSAEGNWIDISTLPKNMFGEPVRTCGYLIRKTAHDIVVAQNHDPRGFFADFTVIPRPLVISIKFIRGAH